MEICVWTSKLLKTMKILTPKEDPSAQFIRIWCAACFTIFLVPCLTFIIGHLDDLPKALESFFYLGGISEITARYFIFLCKRMSISKLMEQLRSHVGNRCKSSPASCKIYEKAESLSSVLVKTYMVLIYITATLFTSLPIGLSYYNRYYRADSTTAEERHLLPILASLPFDTTSLPGYEIALVLMGVSAKVSASSLLALDSFFMTVGLHLRACYCDIQSSLENLDVKRSDSRAIDPIGLRKQQRQELTATLKEIVKFHVATVKMFNDLADIMSGSILIIFSTNAMIVFGAGTVLLTTFTNSAVKYILASMVGLSSLFIHCVFGDEATYQGCKVNKAAYLSNWHSFSPKQRFYVQIIMAKAQEPIYFQGMKMAEFSLRSYLKVIKTIWSMMMVFKRLS